MGYLYKSTEKSWHGLDPPPFLAMSGLLQLFYRYVEDGNDDDDAVYDDIHFVECHGIDVEGS